MNQVVSQYETDASDVVLDGADIEAGAELFAWSPSIPVVLLHSELPPTAMVEPSSESANE